MSQTTPQTSVSAPSQDSASSPTVLTVAKGSGITFAGTIFSYVARFAMGIVLARFLGSEQYGLYGLAIVGATVASGFSFFGIRQALVRYISLFKGRGDSAGVWGTIQIGVGFSAGVSLLCAVGLYFGANFIATELFNEPRIAPLLRLSSLFVPFLTLIEVVGAATQGFGKMQYITVAKNVAQPLIKLILVLLLAVGGLTATKAVGMNIPATIIVSVMSIYFLNGLFSLKRPLNTARYKVREILRFSSPLYLSGMIITFRSNIQTVLLGALNTVTTVGIFIVAAQISQIGQMFHRSIVDATAPIISELYDQEKWQDLAGIYQTTTKWTFMFNLPLFLTVFLFPEAILSIFGSSFVAGSSALIMLALGNLVVAGTGTCGILLDMTGKTSLNMINSIVLSVLIVTLNLMLIPRWGVVGAATATSVSIISVNLLRLIEVFVIFKLLPYNISFLKPVVAGLIVMVTIWFIRGLFQIEAQFIYLVINVPLLFAVYAGLILLFGLSDEDHAVITRIKQRISPKLLK